MAERVGQDIESVCGKCGDTWHVIVACVEGTVAKVQCKECGSQHRYKAPVKATSSVQVVREKKSASKKKTVVQKPLVEPDLSRPVRQYSMQAAFLPGDRITHGTFGDGIVEADAGAGKIQVFFSGDRRILVHDRAEDLSIKGTIQSTGAGTAGKASEREWGREKGKDWRSSRSRGVDEDREGKEREEDGDVEVDSGWDKDDDWGATDTDGDWESLGDVEGEPEPDADGEEEAAHKDKE